MVKRKNPFKFPRKRAYKFVRTDVPMGEINVACPVGESGAPTKEDIPDMHRDKVPIATFGFFFVCSASRGRIWTQPGGNES